MKAFSISIVLACEVFLIGWLAAAYYEVVFVAPPAIPLAFLFYPGVLLFSVLAIFWPILTLKHIIRMG